MAEIVNRVKNSGIISMDLSNYKPQKQFLEIDIATQLWQGIALKEKDFRAWIKENDWTKYQNQYVYVHCSADAIVPTWAFMLVGSCLIDNADIFVIGGVQELQKEVIRKNIRSINLEDYIDGRIIIKGCSDIPFPEFAMVELMQQLQPVAKSIMYGEPCSSVPVFKTK